MLPGLSILPVRRAARPIEIALLTKLEGSAGGGTVSGSEIGFGAAHLERYILGAVTARDGEDNFTLVSASFGGVPATLSAVYPGNARLLTGFACAKVPSGATGDVSLTFSEGVSSNVQVALFRALNLGSAAAYDKDQTGGDPVNALSRTIDVPPGGLLIGVRNHAQIQTLSWNSLANSAQWTAGDGSARHGVGWELVPDGAEDRTVQSLVASGSSRAAFSLASFGGL